MAEEAADSGQGTVSLSEEERRALRQAGRAWAAPSRSAAHPPWRVDEDLDLQERRGALPGDKYVRVGRLRREGLEKVSPGVLQATKRASEPSTGLGRAATLLRRDRTPQIPTACSTPARLGLHLIARVRATRSRFRKQEDTHGIKR